MRRSYAGVNNPNYKNGKTHNNKCVDCGASISFISKRCNPCNHKGKLNPMFGKHRFGKISPRYIDGRKNKIRYCKDCNKKLNQYTAIRCNSCAKTGKLHPNYIDGRGKLPYPPEFNEKLKESIRKRDKNKCRYCDMTKKEHFKKYNRNLEVHHVNGNKNACGLIYCQR